MSKPYLRIYRRTILGLIAGIGVLSICGIGCDSDTRYRVLTFFFEGVPKPGEKKAGSALDANGVSVTYVRMRDLDRDKRRNVNRDKLGQKIASRHDFSRDCAKCHTGGLSSGRQELRTPLPELCFSCHDNLYKEGEYLHGPLNVGECLFCHDPHQSAFVHLQKAPQPDLCLRCHLKDDIILISGHLQVIEGVCTDCHDPHAASAPMLLKAGWKQSDTMLMEELLNMQVTESVFDPNLKSDRALSNFGLSQNDSNQVN